MASTPLVLTWLRVVRDTKLSRGAKALAAVLVTYADANGESCRPGDNRLRDDLTDGRGRLTDRSIRRYRAELVKAGLLVLIRRGAGPGRGRGGGWAAEWRLALPGGNTGQREHSVLGNTGQPEHGVSEKYRTAGSKNTGRREHPHLPKGPPQISLSSALAELRAVVPDTTERETEIIIQNLRIRGARSPLAVLRREIEDGGAATLVAEARGDLSGAVRSACDTDRPTKHSEACRRGDGRVCSLSWCECRCHGGHLLAADPGVVP